MKLGSGGGVNNGTSCANHALVYPRFVVLLKACEEALGAVGVTRVGSDRLLVACSGGADSMALLRVCHTLFPGRVVAAHVDHGLRPTSSDDAALVASVCRHHGIECRVSTLVEAPTDEAGLRSVRYEALEHQRKQAGANWILTAHHRDDQVETVLLHLFRAKRVTSMPARNGCILRPWLNVPSVELRRYVQQKDWPYVEDDSNREPQYLRNRVRKELLPLLERRYSPVIRERIAAWARGVGAREESSGLDQRSSPTPPAPPTSQLPPTLRLRQRQYQGAPVPRSALEVWFDAETVETVELRPFRSGDRIAPFGRFEGRRLVSDILGEAKVPIELRPRFPLAVDSSDSVLWVPGLQRSQHGVVSVHTRRVWVLSIASPVESLER